VLRLDLVAAELARSDPAPGRVLGDVERVGGLGEGQAAIVHRPWRQGSATVDVHGATVVQG